jgi:hypothetical protein
MSDSFGPFVSRAEVEQAILNTLQTPPAGTGYPALVYYLAQAERLAGQPAHTFDAPPSGSYRASIDFTRYVADELPLLIVVVKPEGRPERYERGQYSQWFDVQVAAVVKGDDEDAARAVADAYGVAVANLITQDGGLGPNRDNTGRFAVKTNLEGFPDVEFEESATSSRNVLRTVVTFRTCVVTVLIETGPPSFPQDPYAPAIEPVTVETVATTFAGVEVLP